MIVSDHASTVVADCADCAHSRTHVETLPPGSYHYGRIICADCGKQLCWQPHPRNVEIRQRNANNLRELLGNDRLTDWERDLCQGLSQLKNLRLSPRQQALLNGLVERYLMEENTSADTKRNGAPR
jgi:hypothetical protein